MKKYSLTQIICRTLVAELAASVFLITPAFADVTLRDTVFEDCSKAHQVWDAQPEQDRFASAQYLADVLRLNTQVPDFAGAFYVAPGNQRPADLSTGALWRAVDAKRELEAKRCALKLLSSAGAIALEVLPELVETYTKENLGDEIAVGLEEAAFQIAETSQLRKTTIPVKVIDRLLEHIPSERPLLAANILKELRQDTIPRLLLAIASSPEISRKKYLAYLIELDPRGADTLAAFLSFRKLISAQELLTLSGVLPLNASNLTPSLLQDIAAGGTDPDPAIAKSFITVLGRFCSLQPRIVIPKELHTSLSQQALLPITSLGFTLEQDQKCLLSLLPSISSSVLTSLNSQDDQVLSHGLALFPSAIPGLTAKQRAAAYSTIKEIASQRPAATVAAITALAHFKEKTQETIAFLHGLVKKTPSPLTHEVVTASLMSTLELLPPEKWGAKFTPILIAALSQGTYSEKSIQLLGAAGQPLGASISHAMTQNDKALTTALFRALALQKPPRLDDIEVVTSALGDPSLSGAAVSTLITIGKKSKSPIREMLAHAEPPVRRRLLSILVAINQASQVELNEFSQRTIEGSCEEMVESSEATSSILAITEPAPQLPNEAQFIARIIECLPTTPKALAKQWLEQPALNKRKTLQNFEAVFLSPHSSLALLTTLQVAITEQGMPLQDENGTLSRILQSAPREPLIMILRAVAEVGAVDAIEPSLAALVGSSNSDPELNLAAKWALARITKNTVDPTSLIRERIDRWGNNDDHIPTPGEISALKHLPREGVLSQVQVGLRSGYIPIAVGAARVATALGVEALPLAPRLRELLQENDPPVRYAAALALLTVDPSGADTADALRRVLINRFYPSSHRRSFFLSHARIPPLLDASGLGILRTERLNALLVEAPKDSTPTVTPTLAPQLVN